MFLGTLAPDQAGTELLPSFQSLMDHFEQLWNLYVARQLTRDQFANQLLTLKITDRDGLEWTIGASTREWYRRTVEGKWAESLPPMVAISSAETTSNSVPSESHAPAFATAQPPRYVPTPPRHTAPVDVTSDAPSATTSTPEFDDDSPIDPVVLAPRYGGVPVARFDAPAEVADAEIIEDDE
jgi:hypothetical protein